MDVGAAKTYKAQSEMLSARRGTINARRHAAWAVEQQTQAGMWARELSKLTGIDPDIYLRAAVIAAQMKEEGSTVPDLELLTVARTMLS